MKNLIKFAVALMVIGAFAACNKPEPKPQEPEPPLTGLEDINVIYCKSFVLQYFDINNVSFEEDNNFITIYIALQDVGNFYHLLNNGEKNRERYDELCRKHNDISFDRVLINPTSGMPGIGTYLGYPSIDFTKIDIVSDAAWDNDTPAGMLLNSKVRLFAETIFPYITDGYVSEKESYSAYPFYGVSSVHKYVSDLTTDDLILLGGDGFTTGVDANPNYYVNKYDIAYLYFDASPTLAKTHNITVTLTADDGRTFSDTVQVTWE